MGTTAVHVIGAFVILGLWRKFSKQDIPLWAVLLGGFLAMIIDLDVIIDFLRIGIETKYIFHRVWTHSLIWPALLIAGSLVIRMVKKKEYPVFGWRIKKTHAQYALLFSGVALLSHFALDCVLSGPFYLSWMPPGTYEGVFSVCRPWLGLKGNIAVAGAITLGWFSWMMYKKNFKDVV